MREVKDMMMDTLSSQTMINSEIQQLSIQLETERKWQNYAYNFTFDTDVPLENAN